MSVLSAPYNIKSHAAALAEGLSRGDRVHFRYVINEHIYEVTFKRFMDNQQGVVVIFADERGAIAFPWNEVAELWLVEEKPNIYYSDVPEVAERLKALKKEIQTCVKNNDSAGVLYALDQVIEARKSETFFRQFNETTTKVTRH